MLCTVVQIVLENEPRPKRLRLHHGSSGPCSRSILQDCALPAFWHHTLYTSLLSGRTICRRSSWCFTDRARCLLSPTSDDVGRDVCDMIILYLRYQLLSKALLIPGLVAGTLTVRSSVFARWEIIMCSLQIEVITSTSAFTRTSLKSN